MPTQVVFFFSPVLSSNDKYRLYSLKTESLVTLWGCYNAKQCNAIEENYNITQFISLNIHIKKSSKSF